jgi:GNAT superfamily N-acetyltransferase
MIRSYRQYDLEGVLAVINDGAEAWRGVIPSDQWHEPYMSVEALSKEIAAGVAFRVFEAEGRITGVMGAQPIQDVLLIRHAYVERDAQRQGVGSALIDDLLSRTTAPVLVGTWAAAAWAVGFTANMALSRYRTRTKTGCFEFTGPFRIGRSRLRWFSG